MIPKAVYASPSGLLSSSCGTRCGSRLAKTICHHTANDHVSPLCSLFSRVAGAGLLPSVCSVPRCVCKRDTIVSSHICWQWCLCRRDCPGPLLAAPSCWSTCKCACMCMCGCCSLPQHLDGVPYLHACHHACLHSCRSWSRP